MTDNCPKLFKIDLKCFPSSDVHKLNPETLFSFGFAFAGSTLIGTNVKEILSLFLSNLNEVRLHGPEFADRKPSLPSLIEVAQLVKKIAEKYVASLGVCYPKSCRCEFLVFGFCIESCAYKIFRLCNEPGDPLSINVDDLSEMSFVILGDKKEQITNDIQMMRNRFATNSMNWWRAPFITLSNIVRLDSERTIGGYLQFCIAYPKYVRNFFVSSDAFTPHLIGFDLFKDVGMLGSFVVNPSVGMSLPSENGW